MKKYKVITTETIQKVAGCFTDELEVAELVNALDVLAEEMVFCKQYRERTSEKMCAAQIAIQIIAFTDFCRERMDMLNQLVSSLTFDEITEEEIKRLESDSG